MMNKEKLRLTPPDFDNLSPRQQEVYDKIMASPRGRVVGPLALWLNRPDLANGATELGTYLRYNTALSPKLSELAIIVTARCWSAEFEWFAHAPLAIKGGLDPAIVESIRTRETPVFSDEEEEVVYLYTKATMENGRVDDALYARTLKVLGQDRLVDVTGLIGYYSFVSITLNNFNVMPEDGQPLAFG